jgi:hypothetical protein
MHAVLIVKALEDGVNVLYITPEGGITPPPERLDKGEVLVLAAPEKGDGIRVRGHAEVYTPDHVVISESGLVIGGRSNDVSRNPPGK